MTNRQFAQLAIRLLGIYCLVQLVMWLPLLLRLTGHEWESWSDVGAWTGMWWSAVVLAALTAVLVFGARPIARVVAPGQDEPPAGPADPDRIASALYSVAGVVLVVHALPRLVRTVAGFLARSGPDAPDFPVAEVAGPVVELALGVGLFLGAAALASFRRGLQARWAEMKQAP